MTTIDRSSVDGFIDHLLSIDRSGAHRFVSERISAIPGFDPIECLIVPSLDTIGQRWETGELALSQVYMSAKICEELLSRLTSSNSITPAQIDSPARSAIVVFRDHHGLGKCIVSSMLNASGIPVLDYGLGVETEKLIKRTLADNLEMLFVSVLMLPSALAVKDVIAGLRQAGSSTKVIVGGAPFRLDPELWKEVGADAFGTTASDAVRIASGQTRVTA